MRSSIKIGRDNTNDLVINEPRVGRNHAIITNMGNGRFEVKDLNSENGTYVNGQKIVQQVIVPGDKLQVATSLVDWYAAFQPSSQANTDSAINEKEFATIKKTITVGTSTDNDLVIEDNFVSKHHAKISILKNGNYYIQDMGSSNGSSVNGTKVIAKNFSKTDLVKIAKSDLPADWFQHKKLQPRFFKDNKKKILISLSTIILISASSLMYYNRCNWFGIDCNLNAKQMYETNKNALVHIEHEYFYTISYNGTKYFVGKNKSFIQQTEANPDKQNILPYSKTSGNGCFVNPDGSILTSPLIVNPWFNDAEKIKMLQEVIDSKTIKGLAKNSTVTICGESAELKWIQNGVVNNPQNYVQATGLTECDLTDSSTVIIQSIKKTLPPNATVASYSFNDKAIEKMHNTAEKYYGYLALPKNGESIKDTFYMTRDTVNINSSSIRNLPDSLPAMENGSVIFNSRGELIGVVEKRQAILLNHFINQLNK